MTKSAPICPVCEDSELVESSYRGSIRHADQNIEIDDLECWQCPQCGADPVFPDQARRNHRRYQDARRRADGLLDGAQIEQLRSRLGLTQHKAAELFGGGQNAFSKYERGEVIQSQAMDRLLRLADVSATNFELLKQWSGQETGSADSSTMRKTSHRTKVVPFRQPVAAREQYRKGSETGWHTELKEA
jgi:putative zinc finger/helix-turn-helix YgiT family protein